MARDDQAALPEGVYAYAMIDDGEGEELTLISDGEWIDRDDVPKIEAAAIRGALEEIEDLTRHSLRARMGLLPSLTGPWLRRSHVLAALRKRL